MVMYVDSLNYDDLPESSPIKETASARTLPLFSETESGVRVTMRNITIDALEWEDEPTIPSMQMPVYADPVVLTAEPPAKSPLDIAPMKQDPLRVTDAQAIAIGGITSSMLVAAGGLFDCTPMIGVAGIVMLAANMLALVIK